MTQIIIFLIAVAVIFLTREKWSSFIVLYFKKKKENHIVETNEKVGSVFQPSGTKRMFVIAIEIEEKGNGTAKISLAKLKDNEI